MTKDNTITNLTSIIGAFAAVLVAIVGWWTLRVETAITTVNDIKVEIRELKTILTYSTKEELEDWLKEKNRAE